MINENTKVFESSVVLSENDTSKSNLWSKFLDKVKAIDSEQAKVYLGFGYFLALIIFSFTLFL